MNLWKKSFALGVAAWAAEPVATGASYAENAANAPMALPLTEARDDLYHEMLTG